MEFTLEQVQLILSGLRLQRRATQQNGQEMIRKYQNGDFKGKHHGPQNDQQLQILINQFAEEEIRIMMLVKYFDTLETELL